jgi:ABC-type iron transport system FetAB ATPase subunit
LNSKLAIEIKDLDVRFDSQWVLKDFSLNLAFGEKVTLTGPSGSGKSTVLRCILGLVVPAKGSISIYGESINGHNIWKKRRNLAYVAQEPNLGSGTVREVIENPFTYRANFGLRGNLGRLKEIMERFNLAQSVLYKPISTLSGGEKQRIALVIAILLDRSIVLLDESSSALDKKNKQAVADYFQHTENITLLSVAHDVEWLGFATRIVDMLEYNSIFGTQK